VQVPQSANWKVTLKYWRARNDVGVFKVAEEESSNLLCSKEVTMATQTQPTSRHLSTQHCEETGCGRYTFVSGKEGDKTKGASKQNTASRAQSSHCPWNSSHYPPHIRDCWAVLA